MVRDEQVRVLILADDEDIRSVCADAVTGDSYRTIVVSRGQEALGFLERERVEVFIIELPGPEGDERIKLLSALQERAQQSPVAIVAVTESKTHELRRRARDAGVIDFLSKPIEPIEVACKLQLILEVRRLRADGSRESSKVERCRNIVDAVAEGIGTIDADDRIDFVNSRAAEMFGYSVDEVMGRLATDFVADEHWRRVLREVLDHVRQGRVDRNEYLVRRKDGTTMWIIATGSPLYEAGRYVGAVVTFNDVTRRHTAEEALKRSEQRLSLAIAGADLGVWDWDVVTDTAYLAPEYLRMLAEHEAEVRPALAWFEDHIHPDDRARVLGTMEQNLRGETPQSIIEYRARTSSGEFIWLRGLGRVVARDDTGAPLRMIGVVVDIRDHKRLEDRLRAAITTRDNVLAIAAHDLRNPLAAINLTAELLTERPREHDRRASRSQLELIQRSAAHMRQLIDNVLDAATIEAGTFMLHCTSEELESLVDEVFEEFATLAARKAIHLVRDVQADIPPTWCDATRLREVLANLIGNALKFVAAGGTVRLRSWAQGGDVHFEVADNGPGIPEESLSHLFDRYWTGERGERRGAGLGLFISKGIVDAHHGQMFVESEIGVGTTFHFTIPMKPRVEQQLETVH